MPIRRNAQQDTNVIWMLPNNPENNWIEWKEGFRGKFDKLCFPKNSTVTHLYISATGSMEEEQNQPIEKKEEEKKKRLNDANDSDDEDEKDVLSSDRK